MPVKLAAVNPRTWIAVVLGVWAAGASALAIYLGMRTGWTIAEIRTTKADLFEAQAANDEWSAEAARLQTALDACEAEFASVRDAHERDRNRWQSQRQALASRLQETEHDLATALREEASPELAACLHLPVPDRTAGGLRAAADRAAAAYGDGAKGLGAGTGAPDQPARHTGSARDAARVPD